MPEQYLSSNYVVSLALLRLVPVSKITFSSDLFQLPQLLLHYPKAPLIFLGGFRFNIQLCLLTFDSKDGSSPNNDFFLWSFFIILLHRPKVSSIFLAALPKPYLLLNYVVLHTIPRPISPEKWLFDPVLCQRRSASMFSVMYIVLRFHPIFSGALLK